MLGQVIEVGPPGGDMVRMVGPMRHEGTCAILFGRFSREIGLEEHRVRGLLERGVCHGAVQAGGAG